MWSHAALYTRSRSNPHPVSFSNQAKPSNKTCPLQQQQGRLNICEARHKCPPQQRISKFEAHNETWYFPTQRILTKPKLKETYAFRSIPLNYLSNYSSNKAISAKSSKLAEINPNSLGTTEIVPCLTLFSTHIRTCHVSQGCDAGKT